MTALVHQLNEFVSHNEISLSHVTKWDYRSSCDLQYGVRGWEAGRERWLISPTGQHLVNSLSSCYSSQLAPRRQLHLIFPAQLSSNGTSVIFLRLGLHKPTSLTIKYRQRIMDQLPSRFNINKQHKMMEFSLRQYFGALFNGRVHCVRGETRLQQTIHLVLQEI